jgi:hypothetical protein
MNGWLLAPPIGSMHADLSEIPNVLYVCGTGFEYNLFVTGFEFLRHLLTFVILTTGKMWRHQTMLSFI